MRFPDYRTLVVFSNTISFNPVVNLGFRGVFDGFLREVHFGFCVVFRWRWIVCGWWDERCLSVSWVEG